VFALVVAGLAGCSRDDLYAITLVAAHNEGGQANGAGGGGAGAGNGSSGGGSSGRASGGAGNGNAGSGEAGRGHAGSGNAGESNAGRAGAGDGSSGNGAVACQAATLAPGDSDRTVAVGSVMRSYVLHAPSSYDGSKPVPLVVDFHGIGSSGTNERANSPYPPVLDPEGVVMAFPDGLKGPAGTAWNVGPCCVANVDDVAFARALVEQVRGLACIDARRVYAVGVLTGGGMAHYLGCHAADVFAAVAPAAFDLLAENIDDCAPPRPITVISFRGTADSRVPYAGGPSALVPGMPLTFLGAQATFEKWAAIDACTGTASAADAHGCAAYTNCGAGSEVILCTKQGGGEDPGDPAIAWPVLERHTL
jgi:polyhydroxybutyrate depolymerase